MALIMPRLAYRRRLPLPWPEVEPEMPEGEIPPLVPMPLISPLSPPLDTGVGELPPFSPPPPPKLSGNALYNQLAAQGYPSWAGSERGHRPTSPESRLLTPKGIPAVQSLRDYVLATANLTPEAKAYLQNLRVGTTSEETVSRFTPTGWGGRFDPLSTNVTLAPKEFPKYGKDIPQLMAHELGHAWDFTRETPFGIQPSLVPRSFPTRLFSSPAMLPLIKDYLQFIVSPVLTDRDFAPIWEWYADVVAGNYPNTLEEIPSDIRPLFAGLLQSKVNEARETEAPFGKDRQAIASIGQVPPKEPPTGEPFEPGGTPPWLRGQPLNQLLRAIAIRGLPEKLRTKVSTEEEEAQLEEERLRMLNPNDPLNVLGGLAPLAGPALQLGPKVGGPALRAAQTVGEIGLEAMGQPVRRLGTQLAKEALPTARRVLAEEAGELKVPGEVPKELGVTREAVERIQAEEALKTQRREQQAVEQLREMDTDIAFLKRHKLSTRQAEKDRREILGEFNKETQARLEAISKSTLPLEAPIGAAQPARAAEIARGQERGLSERMRTAETVTFPDGSVISKEAHDILQTDIHTYNQLANKATMAEADRRIATDYTGTLSDLLDLSKPTTPDLMGAGVRFIERGSKEDLALFQEVVAAMDARATTVGQSEQILSQIRTISPEGAMLEAHKVLQKLLVSKGGKITLAEEKALATKGIEVQREIVTAEGKKIVSDAQEMAKFQLEQARAARDIAKANWQEAQRTQKNIMAAFLQREKEAEKEALRFQQQMLRASSAIEKAEWRAKRDAIRQQMKEERKAITEDWKDKQRLWKEAEKHAQAMEVLTGRLVPEARKRARNLERAAVNYGKQAVAKNGLALSDQMAANFMERARVIQALEPGFEQTRRYHQLITDISNFVPPTRWETAMDIYNIPLTLKFAYDAGVMFRQGGLLGLRNPDIWLDTWGPLIKSFSDPAYAERIQTQVASMPLANVMHEAGSAFDELWERTEFFSSKLANKLRGIAGSQRSFTVPMNKIRWESLSRVYESWLPKGYDLIANPIKTLEEFSAITGKSVQEAKDMALLYNNLTLKSNIPWLKAQVGILRLPFFAPGYALSLPEAIGRTAFSPEARKEGARILGSYFGFVVAAEAMGDKAGIWDAELDPRSGNFGKVRFTGTQAYIDPTLGLAGWLKMVAQVVPTPGPEGWQPYHKTATGKLTVQPSAWQDGSLTRFLRGKTHMIPGELWSWAEGQNIVGEKRVLTGPNAESALSVLNMAKTLFAPLTPENIVEGVLDDGLRGGVLSLSNIVGLNVSSYTISRDIQQRTTDILFPGKKYEELDRGQMGQVNDSPEIKALFAQMDQKGNIAEKTTQAYDAYNEAKKVLEIGRPPTKGQPSEVGLRDYIRAGMKGKALAKQIKKFKEARYNLAKGMLTPDVLAYSSQDKKLKPHDIYAQMWLDVPLEEDLQTGEVDFEKQVAERDAILRAAQPFLKMAGRTSDYITKRGLGTFRGKSAEDPEVAKALDEYDKDMETVKPYWEVSKKEDASYKPYADIKKQAQYLQQRYGGAWEDELDRSEKIIWAAREKSIRDAHYDLRDNNPNLDRVLQSWYEYPPLKPRVYPGMLQPLKPIRGR